MDFWFVAAVGDPPVVVGFDLHKKAHSVALFSKEDGRVERCACLSGQAALVPQLNASGRNIAHVIYESGPLVSRLPVYCRLGPDRKRWSHHLRQLGGGAWSGSPTVKKAALPATGVYRKRYPVISHPGRHE